MPKSILPKKLVKTNMCLGKTEIIKRFKYGEESPSIKTVLPKKLVKYIRFCKRTDDLTRERLEDKREARERNCFL